MSKLKQGVKFDGKTIRLGWNNTNVVTQPWYDTQTPIKRKRGESLDDLFDRAEKMHPKQNFSASRAMAKFNFV